MSLNWDSVYEVAIELQRTHPQVDLANVSLGQVFQWTMSLPGFSDDPALCNDEILSSIYQEWFEVIEDD